MSQLIRICIQLKEVGYPNIYLTNILSPDEKGSTKSSEKSFIKREKKCSEYFEDGLDPKLGKNPENITSNVCNKMLTV